MEEECGPRAFPGIPPPFTSRFRVPPDRTFARRPPVLGRGGVVRVSRTRPELAARQLAVATTADQLPPRAHAELEKMLATWFRTVFSDALRSAAICRLLLPASTPATTSRSASDSSTGGRGRGTEKRNTTSSSPSASKVTASRPGGAGKAREGGVAPFFGRKTRRLRLAVTAERAASARQRAARARRANGGRVCAARSAGGRSRRPGSTRARTR